MDHVWLESSKKNARERKIGYKEREREQWKLVRSGNK